MMQIQEHRDHEHGDGVPEAAADGGVEGADVHNGGGPPGPRLENRLVELDVARGFALLGIVLVTVALFALPLGVLEVGGPAERGVLPTAAWVFVAIFCTSKFYPLFSMLFGMGAMLQKSSVEARGGAHLPVALRRMVLLALVGLGRRQQGAPARSPPSTTAGGRARLRDRRSSNRRSSVGRLSGADRGTQRKTCPAQCRRRRALAGRTEQVECQVRNRAGALV